MAFDGLVTFGIAKELQNNMIGGKVDKIFEPNHNEIVLGIYSNGLKYALDIVVSPNNYRLCLTTSAKPNPNFAPSFCMLLRKYLLNTRITNIDTLSLERLVVIEFEGHNKSGDFSPKRLMIELMGKHSNLILLDDKNIIIDALKHFTTQSNSYRDILPNARYVLPVTNKLDFTKISSKDEFYHRFLEFIPQAGELPLSDVLANTYTGISKTSATSIVNELQIEDTFHKANTDLLYEYLNKLLHEPSRMNLVKISDKDYSIHLLPQEKQNQLQMNFFIDDLYSQKETSEAFTTYRNNLSKLILNYMKKLNNKLSNINKKLNECQNTDVYRLYGELLTTNSYRLSETHLDKITLENYYDNNNLITIPLDKAISPASNAKRYFKKYRKLKNAKDIIEIQKSEAQEEIRYLESIIYEFQVATSISDIDHIYNEFSDAFLEKKPSSPNTKSKKKVKKKSNSDVKIGEPIKYQIDGFTVIVGKNNKQNDYITKQATENDIWFHTKDIHGSHVILKTENKTPSQDTINKCAALAAFYSKGSESSNVPVDYTFAKYVKKPSKAKPGMVIYTNHKNVIVKPQNIETK